MKSHNDLIFYRRSKILLETTGILTLKREYYRLVFDNNTLPELHVDGGVKISIKYEDGTCKHSFYFHLIYIFFVHSIWLDSNVPINRTFTNYFIWMLRPLVLNVGIILVILFVIFPITIRRLLCVCLLIGLLFSSSYDTLGIWWCSVYHKYLPIVFKWYY